MIVCSCFGITDGDIRDSMRSGDRDMFAGTCCGSCLPLVSDIVSRSKEDDSSHEPEGAAPNDNHEQG